MQPSSGFLYLVLCVSTFLTSFTTCMSELFYVAPHDNSVCPKQSLCLSLEQFISNVTKTEPVTDLSLLLLSGNHSLYSELAIANVSSFSMTSFESSAVSVMCSQSARLTIIRVNKVKIQRVRFLGCGGSKIASVNNFTLAGSTFHGDENTGTAIILVNSSGNITNSHFLDNSVGTNYSYNNTRLNGDYEEVNVSIAGAVLSNNSNISILNCLFDGNSAENGGAFYAEGNSNVVSSNCTFINTKGTVVYVIKSTIRDEGSVYENNTAVMGAVIYALESDNLTFHGSKFYGNKAKEKGGAILSYTSHIILDKCEAFNNSASEGGVINLLSGTLEIKNSCFYQNSAYKMGGVMYVESSPRLLISASSFSCNEADRLGIFHLSYSILTLQNTTITNNRVKVKGVIHAQDSQIKSVDGLNILENDGKLSVVYLVRCNATFHDDMNFEKNSASLIVIECNITFCGNTIFAFSEYPLSTDKWAQDEGGAISSFQSTLNFYGNTTFKENHSKRSGGAIHAVESIVNFYACVFIDNNTAKESGGGIYLYSSILLCQGETYITQNEVINLKDGIGGGVHAISSSLLIAEDNVRKETKVFDRKKSLLEITEEVTTSNLYFMSNSAGLGGGIGLEGHSKIYILSYCTKINFTCNWSQKGGAIFVNDHATESVCASKWFSPPCIKSECFIQRLHHNSDGYKNITYNCIQAQILFDNNTANITGSILYGGLLDRCTVSQLSYIYYDQYVDIGTITKRINGLEYFKRLSNNMSFNKGKLIASEPVRICFCPSDSEYNCNYLPPLKNVMKGEEFYVTLVAVDQVNHSVEATICSSVSPNGDLGEGQRVRQIGKECKNLIFSVISTEGHETLKIHAEGPCQSVGISTATLRIDFKNCFCATGFQVVHKSKFCECECDPKLKEYLEVCFHNSSITILKRKLNDWISYCAQYNGYLIYRDCPFDFCLPPINDENIFSNGSDSQCNFNRSGKLCGSCRPNFSLSIGSSRCISCDKLWPLKLLVVLLYGILFGITLVTVILALDLTVAAGTINGLLFYANIVSPSSRLFFRHEIHKFFTIAISLLNVTVGFDACFIKGLDAQGKTWLGLLFPTYVFTMVIIMIQISKRSPRFARLLGKGNPIATLATLTLLFYTKLLRNTIKIFSFAILHYPNNSTQVVWRPDAHIFYFRRFHIPLFLVGVIILMAVLIYTALLLSWQWLLKMSNKKLFKFTRNTRLSLFMEANLAPYKPKYRFWMGLLLLVRIVVYLAQAFNFSNSFRLNLVVVGLSVTSLIAIKAYKGGNIYKNQFLDYLELTYYILYQHCSAHHSECLFRKATLSASSCIHFCQHSSIDVSMYSTLPHCAGYKKN